jgi:hypothetical protein
MNQNHHPINSNRTFTAAAVTAAGSADESKVEIGEVVQVHKILPLAVLWVYLPLTLDRIFDGGQFQRKHSNRTLER